MKYINTFCVKIAFYVKEETNIVTAVLDGVKRINEDAYL